MKPLHFPKVLSVFSLLALTTSLALGDLQKAAPEPEAVSPLADFRGASHPVAQLRRSEALTPESAVRQKRALLSQLLPRDESALRPMRTPHENIRHLQRAAVARQQFNGVSQLTDAASAVAFFEAHREYVDPSMKRALLGRVIEQDEQLRAQASIQTMGPPAGEPTPQVRRPTKRLADSASGEAFTGQFASFRQAREDLGSGMTVSEKRALLNHFLADDPALND